MKFRKVLAAVAAAAVAVSMTAINAFAATVTLDSEYPGAWAASAGIPKSEFEAIGGDVKVVLNVELKEPLIGGHNHCARPMNMCVSWDGLTGRLTSDTAIAKEDDMFIFADGQTTLEFVVPESVWSEFKGYVDDEGNEDDKAGLYFQINDVIIKSAELSAGSTEGTIKRVTDVQAADVMDGKSYEEATGAAAPAADEAPAVDDTASADADEAPAVDEAPAADAAPAAAEAPAVTTDAAPAPAVTTTAAATGNTAVASIAAVMAVAGAAAIAAKKRK